MVLKAPMKPALARRRSAQRAPSSLPWSRRAGSAGGRRAARTTRRADDPARQTAQLSPRATVVNTLSPAYVALLLIHLHFPEAGSLKAKRKELASVKAQLHTRLGVAVSEVDGQDTWQRTTLAGALTSGSLKQLQQATDHVEGWLLSRFPDGVRVERSLTSFEDAGGIG
jgi:uncharacterized protein